MSENTNPNVPTTRSTSVLLSTEVEYIPADDLLYYFSEQVGMTFEDYLEGEVINGVTNSVLTFFGAMLKPQVLALVQLGIKVAEICNAINTAMTALDLGAAFYDMYQKQGTQLKVTTNNYQWMSGSGNHITYYVSVNSSSDLSGKNASAKL